MTPKHAEAEELELADDPFADNLTERLDAMAPKPMFNKWSAALAALVLIGIGFVAGALVQQNDAQATTASNAPAGNGQRGAGGYFPQGGFQQGGGQGTGGGTGQRQGNAVAGTVKLVDGNTVYVETAAGETVIVKIGGDTAVRISKTGKASDLKAGTSVTVTGQTGTDGSVTANSITATG